MPAVHVCPLSQIAPTVRASGARHMVSVINEGTPVLRPAEIMAENHLFLGFNDIVAPADGMTAPAEVHVETLIGFFERWDRAAPIVVHCYAGISRSTAAAFIALCALEPQRDERETARALRKASRFATPNSRLVAIADRLLARDGRMVAAIAEIGRGEDAYENIPFVLPLGT